MNFEWHFSVQKTNLNWLKNLGLKIIFLQMYMKNKLSWVINTVHRLVKQHLRDPFFNNQWFIGNGEGKQTFEYTIPQKHCNKQKCEHYIAYFSTTWSYQISQTAFQRLQLVNCSSDFLFYGEKAFLIGGDSPLILLQGHQIFGPSLKFIDFLS